MDTFKVVMTKEAFGERLSQYVQKSREIPVDHEIRFHIQGEGDKSEIAYDTDDVFGLMCALGSIRNSIEPKILADHPDILEYGMDVFNSKGDDKPYIQFDCNTHRMELMDIRFKADVLREFGYHPAILQLVQNYMVNMYED